MNIHKNARLTPIGRERLVREVASGQTPQAIARAAGVCPRTVRKWVARYKAEGLAGLADRSSRPRHLYRPVETGHRSFPNAVGITSPRLAHVCLPRMSIVPKCFT